MKPLKAIRTHGYQATGTRQALKRPPSVSELAIRRQRLNLRKLFKEEANLWPTIKPTLHPNFRSVDHSIKGMADPLERERTRLAFEETISQLMVDNAFESVFHATIALPQHIVPFGKLHKVKPEAVRRNFEETIRRLRKINPTIFSAGMVEIQGLYVNGEARWSAHLHALVFNVDTKTFRNNFRFRELNNFCTAYRPVLCKTPNDPYAPLTWSNYIAKFRVFGSIKKLGMNEFRPAKNSDNKMPNHLKREVALWYSAHTLYNLTSFVGMPQSVTKRFYHADLESILICRNRNWKSILDEYYRH